MPQYLVVAEALYSKYFMDEPTFIFCWILFGLITAMLLIALGLNKDNGKNAEFHDVLLTVSCMMVGPAIIPLFLLVYLAFIIFERPPQK